MVSSVALHCDCGTDVRIATTDDPARCPDCGTAFALSLVEHLDDHDAPSYRHGTRSYRGP